MTVQEQYKFRVPDEIVILLHKLHPTIKANLRRGLQIIGQNPYSGKPLKEELADLRSFRVKKYRVIYRILEQDKILELIAIGPRKNIYEETLNILTNGVRS